MTRYINADKELQKLEDMNLSELGEQEKFGVQYAKLILSNSPTANVAEIKHGKWVMVEPEFDIGSSAIYECSLCGRKIGCDKYPTKRIPNSDYPVAVSVEELFPYCHCGAKMEEKND